MSPRIPNFPMRTQFEDEDEHSRILYEMQSLIVHFLKFPLLPLPFSTQYSHVASSSTMRHLWTTLLSSQVSPAAFASLFLGISLALMLFGSLAFVVGFMLLPWVTALVISILYCHGTFNLVSIGSDPSWFCPDAPQGYTLFGFIQKLTPMSC